MAKIHLTENQVNTIITKVEEVKGTPEFSKYNMETSVKYINDKKYTFIGWGIPNTFSDNTNFYISRGFIYKEIPSGIYRYRLTDNVKELLGL
jgi:hypothetical protein